MKISARPILWCTAILALGGSLGLLACDSVLGTSNLQIGVTCGPGTANDGGACLPSTAVDPRAPSFGGVLAVSPASATTLRIDWDPAVSATAKEADLHYSVYVATAPGSQNFATPDGVITGATTYTAKGLTTGTDYFVVVRAADAEGHQDSNTVELHAKAQQDSTAPVFGGIVNAAPSTGGGTVTLSWSPAQDDLTGADGITYLAFAAEKDPVVPGTPLGKITGKTSLDVVVPKPLTPFRFVVRAQDASGNTDSNTKEVVAISGPDTVAPTFGGCSTAMSPASNKVTLGWAPGHDDVTPESLLNYDVYAFATPGPHALLESATSHATVQGMNSVTVDGLAAGTTYYFICHARDLSGNIGGNPADKVQATLPDVTAPTFGGILTATPVTPSSYQIALGWAPASDYQTPANALTYEIFVASTAGTVYGPTSNPAATVVGQSKATVLVKPGQLNYIAVRAKDEAGNRSPTMTEATVNVAISYTYQIQPIFTASCVNGCHTLNQKNYNPILADPVSYTFVIADGVVVPNSPSTSALYKDMVCLSAGNCVPGNVNQMPPNNSGNPTPSAAQIALVRDWIIGGAPGPIQGLSTAPPGF
jgi:hypothetical protein